MPGAVGQQRCQVDPERVETRPQQRQDQHRFAQGPVLARQWPQRRQQAQVEQLATRFSTWQQGRRRDPHGHHERRLHGVHGAPAKRFAHHAGHRAAQQDAHHDAADDHADGTPALAGRRQAGGQRHQLLRHAADDAQAKRCPDQGPDARCQRGRQGEQASERDLSQHQEAPVVAVAQRQQQGQSRRKAQQRRAGHQVDGGQVDAEAGLDQRQDGLRAINIRDHGAGDHRHHEDLAARRRWHGVYINSGYGRGAHGALLSGCRGDMPRPGKPAYVLATTKRIP